MSQIAIMVVAEDDDKGQFAKYDRFGSKGYPRAGKIGAAISAAKFGFKVASRWSQTPAGRRAIGYFAAKSKYTRYGTGVAVGAYVSTFLGSSPRNIGETRTDLVFNRPKFRNNSRRHRTRRSCCC